MDGFDHNPIDGVSLPRIEKFLGEEGKILTEARIFVEAGIPILEEEIAPWRDRALKYQMELATLETRLKYSAGVVQRKLLAYEAELLQADNFESRTRDGRKAEMHLDPKYSEMSGIHDTLSVLSSLANSYLWILKTAFGRI